MLKSPTLLLKYSVGFFIVGLGIYFGSLATREGDPGISRGHYKYVFAAYIVGSFMALFIYYLPTTLKDLEMAPSRRYAWLVMHTFLNDTAEPPPKEILDQLEELFNSPCFDEQDARNIHRPGDAVSWKASLEDIRRPHGFPASDSVAIWEVNSRDNTCFSSVDQRQG